MSSVSGDRRFVIHAHVQTKTYHKFKLELFFVPMLRGCPKHFKETVNDNPQYEGPRAGPRIFRNPNPEPQLSAGKPHRGI